LMPYGRSKRFLVMAILLLVRCLFIPGIQSRALANQLGTELELTLVPGASVAVLAGGGYWLWKNRLKPQDHGKLWTEALVNFILARLGVYPW
jgi:hypothetical protein